MKNIGGSDFIVSANDRDLAEIKKNKKNLESDIQKAYDAKISIKLDNTPIASIGGVIVSSTDGKRVYYNTFDGRISKIEIKMNTILAKQLEAL
jgi:vacuolar-type H+-ATPase subunit E/Vma4